MLTLDAKAQLQRLIGEALNRARDDGALDFEGAPDIILITPPRREQGDLASNIALTLAKQARRKPLEIAEEIVARLDAPPELVADVEAAPPGFINFRLSGAWLHATLQQVLEQTGSYGRSDVARGKRVLIEYVSANPVGPIHIGNARGGPIGDVIGNLMAAQGWEVTREYLLNNGANNTQFVTFGDSLRGRYLEALGESVEWQDEWYRGDYVTEFGQLWAEEHSRAYADRQGPEDAVFFARLAYPEIRRGLEDSCAAFGCRFDVWTEERELMESGRTAAAIEELKDRGATYERDGAVWLRTTDCGDDKDRVLVRSTGAPTYLATDAAYHKGKFDRGFDLLINIWGPDHRGHIARTKAAVAGLGYDPDRLLILIYEMVRLTEGDRPVDLSKRKGSIFTMVDLVGDIGRDASRFFLLMRKAEAPLDLDLDLARKQSRENPVYYVQYVHARTCAVFREAQAQGFECEPLGAAPLERLARPDELALLGKLAEFPETIAGAAEAYEPHRLTAWSQELAKLFHQWYSKKDECRILSDDRDLSHARLALVGGTQVVLRNVCHLLGIEAPERM